MSDIDAVLNQYHNRVAAHKLASTCPDEWESAAQQLGGDLNLARKPDSTWQSTVKVFREHIPVWTDTNGDVHIQLGKLLEYDVHFTKGTTDGGTNQDVTVIPANLLSQTFWYRDIGRSIKFTPTIAQDNRGGEIAMLAFTGATTAAVDTIPKIRDYPWGEVVSYVDGAHMDVAHSKFNFNLVAFVQGGAAATPMDCALPINIYYDPDTFMLNDGAAAFINNSANILHANNYSMTFPYTAALNSAIDPRDMYGTANMVISFPLPVAATKTLIGSLEVLRILEISVPSQLYTPQPITANMKPGTLRMGTSNSRARNKAQDLKYIVEKSEGALGWIGQNWRGIAKQVVDIADVGTSIGSMLSIPGAGALDAGVGFLKGIL